MKDRPIIFSGPMVREILAGRKTQTRRVVGRVLNFGPITEFDVSDTPGYNWHFRDSHARWQDISHDRLIQCCPYGRRGDRLWVRETWGESVRELVYGADYPDNFRDYGRPWGNAMFMPRYASRIRLEITGARAERVQEISGEDAIAEGIQIARCGCEACSMTSALCPADASAAIIYFRAIWDHVNAKRGHPWDSNPWVWAISFRRIV